MEEVEIEEGKSLFIGNPYTKEKKEKILGVLKKNQHVFVWHHQDSKGITLNIWHHYIFTKDDAKLVR